MQPILKMFDRRALILEEDAAMRASLADPNRALLPGPSLVSRMRVSVRKCVCVCVYVSFVVLRGVIWCA